MLYIGIDVASKKHDCCIIGDGAEILAPVFTFENNAEGYDVLLKAVRNHCRDFKDVRIGIESTGHYSNNLISFLQGKGFCLAVFNPLQVNLFRKAQSLRKTKTDKADARFLAQMLMSSDHPIYAPQSLEISELKALVHELKSSKARLPEVKPVPFIDYDPIEIQEDKKQGILKIKKLKK